MARTKARVGSSARKTSRVISSKTVFRGKIFTVTSDELVEPSGVKVKRDTIRHPGSAVILAVDRSRDEPRVLLVRQYRYPADAYLWELPAGRVDPGENALSASKRELAEETGYTAKSWQRALSFYSSPGFIDEKMWLYIAEELQRGKAKPEEDEFISLRFVPLSAAVRQVQAGSIQDGKTIAGVLWLQARESAETRK